MKKYYLKARAYSNVLQHFPFVKAILLNGSVATNNSKPSSDIDLLIITKEKRLWTCRFFVLAFLSLLRQKRSKNGGDHAGKFCANYFMTENHLIIPHDRDKKTNEYCAQNYSASILLAGDEAVFQEFMAQNLTWWREFGIANLDQIDQRQNNKTKFWFIKSMIEFFLTGKAGDFLEKRCKSYQIGKIEKDSRTKKYPNFIVYNDSEARFHPPKG